jgi:hypothetical protein
MDNILVLWDIDGTLNVHGRGNHWAGQWLLNTVTRQEVPALFAGMPEKFQEFKLRVNEDLLTDFSSLSVPGVTHQWLTAWEQEAKTVFSPKFGFSAGEAWDSISPVHHDHEEETGVWWKTTAVREILSSSPETKVIWVDDLIDHTDRIEEDNRQLNLDFPDRLAMVGVMAHQGVTPDVFAFIKHLAMVKFQGGMFLFE